MHNTTNRWGKTKAKLAAETVDTPLQEKLDVLANQIGNGGIAAAICTFLAMVGVWVIYPSTRYVASQSIALNFAALNTVA